MSIEKRTIEVTGCDDCPHCDLWQPVHPGIWAVRCQKANCCDTVTREGFPVWCPLNEERGELIEGIGWLPSFLRRQAT